MRQTLANTYFEHMNTYTWLGWLRIKLAKLYTVVWRIKPLTYLRTEKLLWQISAYLSHPQPSAPSCLTAWLFLI